MANVEAQWCGRRSGRLFASASCACPRSPRRRAAVRTVENPFSYLRRPRQPSLSRRRHPAGIVESFANSIRLLIVSMLDRTPASSHRIERNSSSHPTTKTSIRTAIKRTKSLLSSISKPTPSCASRQHATINDSRSIHVTAIRV